MDRNADSDMTMLASETFDGILKRIQTSRLNFSIQLTPFSAVISMRKSFVTDRSGSVFLPTTYDHTHDQKANDVVNLQLERNLNDLEKKHVKAVGECTIAHETIKKLQQELQDREDTIKDLQISLAKSRESAFKLNQALSETITKYAEEKRVIFKEHKFEVKQWRKDLGEANRKHINLEKKFELLERSTDQKAVRIVPDVFVENEGDVGSVYSAHDNCSICSIPIDHFIQEYFLGEKINPACSLCKEDCSDDPFSSFPSSDIPPSLVVHWLPISEDSGGGLGSISSLRAHYVTLPNPGDTFVTTKEVLQEFRAMWEEQRRELRESCHQS